MKYQRLIGCCITLPFVVACSTDISHYANKTPKFSMTDFFQGELCAKGLVRERNKRVNRKFVATILANSTPKSVTLDEYFVFDDGEKQTRIWNFRQENGKWKGTAGDVVGNAIAQIAGDTLNLKYELEIALDDGDTVHVKMDDWLHLVDKNTLMGSTKLSKWGIDVGQIDISIEKTQCR